MVVMNLTHGFKNADYVETGYWSSIAIMENKSGSELAVNLIDMTGSKTSLIELGKQLGSISGVIRLMPIIPNHKELV